MSVNGMVRPCSCPASKRSWQGTPETVEDEPVVGCLIVDVLGDLGYRALEAADGPKALEILQSSRPIDLLITDIGLPR